MELPSPRRRLPVLDDIDVDEVTAALIGHREVARDAGAGLGAAGPVELEGDIHPLAYGQGVIADEAQHIPAPFDDEAVILDGLHLLALDIEGPDQDPVVGELAGIAAPAAVVVE